MIQSIFYKEWIKLRWGALIAAIALIILSFYTISLPYRVVKLHDVSHLWEVMVMKDIVFVDTLKLIPLIMGAFFAVLQFVPEMQDSRLKLTLHLPMNRVSMLAYTLLAGLLPLLLLFLVSIAIILLGFANLVPVELYSRVFATILPWYLSGVVSYFIVAWIVLEPTWKRRIYNSVLSLAVLSWFFEPEKPNSGQGMVVLYLFLLLFSIFMVYFSVERFRQGKQD